MKANEMQVELAQSSLSAGPAAEWCWAGFLSPLQSLISSLPCVQCWSLCLCKEFLGAAIEALDSQNALMAQTAWFASQHQV